MAMIGIAELAACARGIPWKLSSSTSGSNVKRIELRAQILRQRVDVSGSSWYGGSVRRAGCQRIVRSLSAALSTTVAVVAAQYCG